MTRPKILTAIDVGSSKISVLIGQKADESDLINIVGAASFPSAGVRKGQIVNIEEATNAIIRTVEAAERMAGFSVSHVLLSVGGAHISSQNSHGLVAVANPAGEIVEDDIRRAIEAARAISLPSSREILHVIPRSYTVDSQTGIADPKGMSGVRLEVETHIITGSSTAIKNLTKCVSEVGANIDALVFSGLASAEAVLTDTEKELGVVLLDIGGGTTSLVIFIESAPVYTAVLPIGAKNITNDLAIGLRLSLEGAEKLKLSLLEEPEKKKEKEAKEEEIDLAKLGIFEESRKVSLKTITEGIIKPRLDEIFGMVALEIQKSGLVGLTPSGVVLTGGGALTKGAVEACKRSLSLPVRIGSPSEISGLVDDILSPIYATSVGLLRYGFKNFEGYTPKISLPKLGEFPKKVSFSGFFDKIKSFFQSFLP